MEVIKLREALIRHGLKRFLNQTHGRMGSSHQDFQVRILGADSFHVMERSEIVKSADNVRPSHPGNLSYHVLIVNRTNFSFGKTINCWQSFFLNSVKGLSEMMGCSGISPYITNLDI